MFEGLSENQLTSAIQAMLFVTDGPVSTITMADMLQVEPSVVESACVELRARLLEDEEGIQLTEVAGGWRLCTHPAFHELLEAYVLSWDTRKLSQAALEVLAVVAYSQPVTRAGVADVRGVNSDSSLNSLMEKGLVREVGTSDAPGNPTLYGTTPAFLEKFGLRSLKDLPDITEFAPDDETRDFIRTRLSATRGYIPPVREAEALDEPPVEQEPIDDVEPGQQQSMDDAMRQMMAGALAEAAGAVEKIDFDDLEFEE